MKPTLFRPTLWLALVLLVIPTHVQAQATGFRVPPGFEVTEFADANLANDIYCLTFDPRGRVTVSGRDYIRILVDDDGDGKADRALEFAREPREGAQGLWWEGSTLYAMGDGGLRRLHDKNGEGKADGPSELIRKMKTGGEHCSHAICRGPDGWLYVLCGNDSGIGKSYASLPTSPIKDPVGGCVLRFPPHPDPPPPGGREERKPDSRPPGKKEEWKSEIVCQGFRNAYGMDFNLEGELFTFDSDNERCVSLPWYEPTRFYHVIPGGHYGWLSPQRTRFWRMPPYFVDVAAPIATLGRGSPTGVVCYRHGQFPEEYHGGFFLLDWTFGKIYFAQLERKGSSYTCQPKIFLEATGDNGFAPTACAVHPQTGDLYVSIGGRGTRGAVYRIRYPKGLKDKSEPVRSASKVREQTLDWQPDREYDLERQAKTGEPHQRLQALLYLERHRKHLATKKLYALITANWDHPDRYLRQVTARLIGGLTDEEFLNLTTWHKLPPRGAQTVALGIYAKDPRAALPFLKVSFDHGRDKSSEDHLADLRLCQLLLGEIGGENEKGTVWEGYSRYRNRQEKWHEAVWQLIPRTFRKNEPEWNREVARLWALCGDIFPRPGEATDFESMVEIRPMGPDPVENLHYLMAFAGYAQLNHQQAHHKGYMPGKVAYLANHLLALDKQIRRLGLNRDNNWNPRVNELYAGLASVDAKLNDAILDNPDFGRPDHVLFTQVPGFDQRRAATIFLGMAEKDPNFPWNPALIEILDQLPDDRIRPTLDRLWGQAGLDTHILPLLARIPRETDRAKFAEGLVSPDLFTVRACMNALEKLPVAREKNNDPEIPALIRALGQIPQELATLRTRVAKRLGQITGQDFGLEKQAWLAWYTRANPEQAARLNNPDGVDVAGWQKRLARLDLAGGDDQRGFKVFQKASCINCHSGGQGLGPDLVGVTQRFSRDDLFTAILQPSRDVPVRYQTTLIETNDGKVYQGLVIYHAVDGLILQTGASVTIRIPGSQIAQRRVSPTSLMPAGLLDPLTDGEIGDLYAYLRSLGKK